MKNLSASTTVSESTATKNAYFCNDAIASVIRPMLDELKLLEAMRRYGPHCDFTIRKRATRTAPQGVLIDLEISFKEPITFANVREFHIEQS